MSSVVELLDVKLVSLESQQSRTVWAGELSVSVAAKADASLDSDGAVLQVDAAFKMEGRRELDGEADPVVSVQAVFGLSYKVPEEASVSGEAMSEFAAQNGVFNAWPYWRELVQSMTMRMGFPGFICPLFRIKQEDGSDRSGESAKASAKPAKKKRK